MLLNKSCIFLTLLSFSLNIKHNFFCNQSNFFLFLHYCFLNPSESVTPLKYIFHKPKPLAYIIPVYCMMLTCCVLLLMFGLILVVINKICLVGWACRYIYSLHKPLDQTSLVGDYQNIILETFPSLDPLYPGALLKPCSSPVPCSFLNPVSALLNPAPPPFNCFFLNPAPPCIQIPFSILLLPRYSNCFLNPALLLYLGSFIKPTPFPVSWFLSQSCFSTFTLVSSFT